MTNVFSKSRTRFDIDRDAPPVAPSGFRGFSAAPVERRGLPGGHLGFVVEASAAPESLLSLISKRILTVLFSNSFIS